ncbi:MAG: PrgI family protein [Candidatus Magasanikbacteria bacterium]
MQQFVIPQFIDVEDKIFGPITTRQFLILLVAGICIFLSYRFADLALFIVVLAVMGGLALVFAFVKINGQTFHYFLLNIIQTLRKPSLRIWRKFYHKKELEFLRKQVTEEKIIEEKAKPVHRERIRDLALLVNTGGFYKPEE